MKVKGRLGRGRGSEGGRRREKEEKCGLYKNVTMKPIVLYN
jgi:hypothetical protein